MKLEDKGPNLIFSIGFPEPNTVTDKDKWMNKLFLAYPLKPTLELTIGHELDSQLESSFPVIFRKLSGAVGDGISTRSPAGPTAVLCSEGLRLSAAAIPGQCHLCLSPGFWTCVTDTQR